MIHNNNNESEETYCQNSKAAGWIFHKEEGKIFELWCVMGISFTFIFNYSYMFPR